jgi:hypothetical protein
MRKGLLAAALGAASLFVAAGSASAQTAVVTGPSGTFGNDTVTCDSGAATGPCSFSDTITFTTPTGFQLLNATLSASETTNPLTFISFDTITLNGVSFNAVTTGTADFYTLFNQLVVSGNPNTLFISGTSGGNAAYSGTLTFAAGAVPEPGTWAMMLLGFGGIGFAMRRKRSKQQLLQLA